LNKNVVQTQCNCFYSIVPNRGAGIGHQLANWITAYIIAKKLGIRFAYIPFSSKEWDSFLGFSKNEVFVSHLLNQGYKLRKLPKFDPDNKKEFEIQKRIVGSYKMKRVVFLAESDQNYRELFEAKDDLQDKFFSAQERENNNTIFSSLNFNIAMHIRRGDIMADSNNKNLTMRIVSNNYYKTLIDQILAYLKVDKPIHIYIFSQGVIDDFPEFHGIENIHWCMDMGAKDSFLHMVYADMLITGKSSFSYKPALLNRGIKVCPENFWHGYPNSADWILVNNDGIIVNNKATLSFESI